MDNPIEESSKIEEDEKTTEQKKETDTKIVAASTSPVPIINYEAKTLARDAKARRKDEKTVQQVLRSLGSYKTPEEKLAAICKKYAELLHENRQMQATIKEAEKNIIVMHREKEQYRNERSKAILEKTRMEKLCREFHKLNKAQLEETALKLRVEDEKRKELCSTFQSAFAEMNTLTNQNNEKSAKMREENLEMREKMKSVRERIELTEIQLEKVKHQAKLELELEREKLLRVTQELTAEKEVLMEDKARLLVELTMYHVHLKESQCTEEYLRKQIQIHEVKLEEFRHHVTKEMESLKVYGTNSKEMTEKTMRLEKETAVWKQRWKKITAEIFEMADIKNQQDEEMATLSKKLSTLQDLCKALQHERKMLITQLRMKNDGKPFDCKMRADENRKSMKQVEIITKDSEKLRDNLLKLGNSMNAGFCEILQCGKNIAEEEVNYAKAISKANKTSKKSKNKVREKLSQKKKETSKTPTNDEVEGSKTVDETNEMLKGTENMENAEENNTEGSDAKIAMLDRHKTVSKDIEQLLVDQALLETKIACSKEIDESITDTTDSRSESIDVDNEKSELSENLDRESVKTEDALINDKEEIANPLDPSQDLEFPTFGDNDTKELETTQEMIETNLGLIITEVDIDHDESESDSATCEAKSIANDDRANIVVSEATEDIADSTEIQSYNAESAHEETIKASEVTNSGDQPLKQVENVATTETLADSIEEKEANCHIDPVPEINNSAIEA